MKFLLLVALLTGATAHSISRRALTQFNNVIKCIIPGNGLLAEYHDYASYCGFGSSDTTEDDLDPCCETLHNCYGQVMKMESCKSLIDNPYTSAYSFSCSKNKVTCSDKNNPCENFICNCDREAAICFFQNPYYIEYKTVDY
ncbi:phospholipase A2-like isoform X2 [Peromyscus leucopus]|uniref:phospholipase A2-like isoform X2 n=1 Tax=Peromyscus leucopus TaxID=10041 RepID=UPI0018855BB7|nr:phospholipase A2-like isoform X2 [Peromyscus leucopus]